MKKALLISGLSLLSGLSFAQNLAAEAENIRREYGIPEMAFAVIQPDTIIEYGVLGYHRAGENDTAALSDFFHLGSNTKAITGFVAAYLVEQGAISWDTEFFDLFPGWKTGANPAYYDVTLLQLLSHRAGVQPYTSGLEFMKIPEFKGDVAGQRQQFVQFLLSEEPVAKEEDQIFVYSNAGYSAAAVMLEKVSGKTSEELVTEILQHKLHLALAFGWPHRIDANQPWGHWENGGQEAVSPEVDYNLALAEPAGDICMPVADYARFVQMNLRGLTGENNFLKADTYRFLHYGMEEYAIGWLNMNTEEKTFSEHMGSAGTFLCYTLIDLQQKTAYVVITNSATENAEQGLFKLLKAMRKRDTPVD